MVRMRLAAMSAVVALVLASCSSDKTTAPADISSQPTAAQAQAAITNVLGANLVASLVASTNAAIGGLMKCTPLPATSVSSVVGPQGGVINVGPHTLTIPSGALSSPVTITAQILGDSASSVVFQPEGLQFSKSAQPVLALSYANCSLLGLPASASMQIVYTTNSLQLLSVLNSYDDLLHRKVYAPLAHFSRYAVAW